MKVIKWGGVAFVLLAIGAAFYLYDPLEANPSADALSADAKSYRAEIIRDKWGVPHIFGERDADASFGLAYAHSEDDFETIQETVAATRGVLASYRGAAAAPTDYIVYLFGVWETIDARYSEDVPADVKAIAEGYAAGLNLYASQNPNATWAGLAPFTPQDIVAGFIFKTPFFYGLDGDLMELFGEERNMEIALDPTPGREAFNVAKKTLSERGSNAIAVSPQRSGDDVTRLIINSHQPMTGPVAWYEAHIVSDEGMNILGGLFPGTPVVLHGFTQNLGWANTVSEQDLADVYRLTINPNNPSQYKLDDEWREFDVTEAAIKVRLWGPFAFTSKQAVKHSVHGPVIESTHGTYALRYAGMDEIRQLEQVYRLGRAKNLDQFMGAMSLNAMPSNNYVYADKDGNVAFIHNGQYPARLEGWDWSKDLPGDRSDLIWSGYRPYSEAPMLINPESGLVFNANNQPFVATDGTDNLQPSDFPTSMGLQTNMTNRAMRLVELTDSGDIQPISRQRLLDIKFDLSYSKGSKAAKVVESVLSEDWSADERLNAAAETLRAWNFSTHKDDRQAALGVLTSLPKTTEKYTGIEAPAPREAFITAVDYLYTHYGRVDPAWGEVNRIVRGDVNLPVDGGPDILRAIYPASVRDDGQLHAHAGDTWIALVEWDEDGQLKAQVINQFGSAVLDETSPHYSDQVELFVNKEWRTAEMDRAAIEANAEKIYSVGGQ